MDSDHFDRLTRMLGRRFPRRRVVVLSALTLGLTAGSPRHAAEARKNKHRGEEKCGGEWVKRCTGGQIRNDADCTCVCPPPTGLLDRCGECVPIGGCCSNEKKCGSNCILKEDCCDATERTCRKTVKKRGKKKTVTFCVTRPACCPGEQTCPIAAEGCCNPFAGEECTPFDGCCNTLAGAEVCDGKWCCQQNEKCCPGEGCVPKTQCCDGGASCPADPRHCCDPGEKCCAGLGCRPTTDACCVLTCPSSPTGCCQQGEQCCPGEGCILDTEECEQTSCLQGQPCGDACCTGTRTCCLNSDSGFGRCCDADSTCYPGSGNDVPACCGSGTVGCHGDCCNDNTSLVKCCDTSNGQTHCVAVFAECPA
jgi:hypothetical protein